MAPSSFPEANKLAFVHINTEITHSIPEVESVPFLKPEYLMNPLTLKMSK